MTAAYAEPGVVPALMMMPAFAHGARPSRVASGPSAASSGSLPVIDASRTVMLPAPAYVHAERTPATIWSMAATVMTS